MAQQMVVGLAFIVLMMASTTVVTGGAPTAYPSCGEYVGVEYFVSKSGDCLLPDGELMQGGVWAPRNPGQPVTYVVNWTTGSDQSQGKYQGYAALHGCTGDTVKFVWSGSDAHNLVEVATQPQAPCNLTNAIPFVGTEQPGFEYNLTNPLDSFRNFADSLGNNCVTGKMHIQVIMHRPTTQKYGCYKVGGHTPPGYRVYNYAPPPPGGSVAAPVKSPPPPPPPSPKPTVTPVPSPKAPTTGSEQCECYC